MIELAAIRMGQSERYMVRMRSQVTDSSTTFSFTMHETGNGGAECSGL